jgi:hypothetical protein
MTGTITNPPAAAGYRACYRLFYDIGIGDFQQVAPDLFSPRAHARAGRRYVAGLPLSPTFAGMAFALAAA